MNITNVDEYNSNANYHGFIYTLLVAESTRVPVSQSTTQHTRDSMSVDDNLIQQDYINIITDYIAKTAINDALMDKEQNLYAKCYEKEVYENQEPEDRCEHIDGLLIKGVLSWRQRFRPPRLNNRKMKTTFHILKDSELLINTL